MPAPASLVGSPTGSHLMAGTPSPACVSPFPSGFWALQSETDLTHTLEPLQPDDPCPVLGTCQFWAATGAHAITLLTVMGKGHCVPPTYVLSRTWGDVCCGRGRVHL